MQILTEEIAQLQQSHTTMVAKIAECKRQLLLLSHRVLKVREMGKDGGEGGEGRGGRGGTEGRKRARVGGREKTKEERGRE